MELPPHVRLHYEPSPEHKTHPGPWGKPSWHLRQPPITPCPTDITAHQAQRWLEEALTHDSYREPPEYGRPPRYLYWYVPDRGELFEARFTGSRSDGWAYKGYPISPSELPVRVRRRWESQGLLEPADAARLRREARRDLRRKT